MSATNEDIIDLKQAKSAVDNFNRYFKISSGKPDMDKLEEILAFFARIPYENLSKIIKLNANFNGVDKIRLPLEVLEDYFTHNLGGTCFSLTHLLHAILFHHGFSCYPVGADMPRGTNVHSAMIVTFPQKYLVDPGYMLNHPLKIPHYPEDQNLDSSFNSIKLVHNPNLNLYHFYTCRKNLIKERYTFKDVPLSPELFLKFWLKSFYWNSLNNLCLTRVMGDRIIYIHKTFMRETFIDKKINHNIKINYQSKINTYFGIGPGIVESAVTAAEDNKRIKAKLGLWQPKVLKRAENETSRG